MATNKYYDYQIDPFDSDQTYPIHIQSAYYSGTIPNILAPESVNFPDDTPTKAFLKLPYIIDVSALDGARPISLYDVTDDAELTRVTGVPGSGEYRLVTNTDSHARHVIQLHTDQLNHELGFDLYALGSNLLSDDLNSILKGVSAIVIASENSSIFSKLNANLIIPNNDDDTASKIQSKIDEFYDAGYGCNITFMEGDYYFRGSRIVLKSNTQLRCCGKVTFYRAVNALDSLIYIGDTGVENITIDGLKILGENGTYTAAGQHGIIIRLNETDGETKNINIINCDIQENYGCGIFIDSPPTGDSIVKKVNIENCIIDNNTTIGININKKVENVYIEKNRINNNGNRGINIYTADAYVVQNHDVVIEKNIIQENGAEGLYAELLGRGKFLNNTITSNGGEGIEIAGCEHLHIRDNTVLGNVTTQIRLTTITAATPDKPNNYNKIFDNWTVANDGASNITVSGDETGNEIQTNY